MLNKSEKPFSTVKEVRIEIPNGDRKPESKVILFDNTGPSYQKLGGNEAKGSHIGKRLSSSPQSLAFRAFSWGFSIFATAMMIFVLFLLIFLIYETIVLKSKSPRIQDKVEIILFE